MELATNVDDCTGEALADAVAALLAAGARDAWITHAVMKKGRPAAVVQALCAPGEAGQLARVLVRATGTLGVRVREVTRVALPRRHEVAQTAYGDVRVKAAGIEGAEVTSVKPERDDVAQAAAAAGVAAAVVEAAARRDVGVRVGDPW